MKNPSINKKERAVLKSMNLYWEEIALRDHPNVILFNELRNLQNVLSPIKILSIISLYIQNDDNFPAE